MNLKGREPLTLEERLKRGRVVYGYRLKGLTYQQIGRRMGQSAGWAWTYGTLWVRHLRET